MSLKPVGASANRRRRDVHRIFEQHSEQFSVNSFEKFSPKTFDRHREPLTEDVRAEKKRPSESGNRREYPKQTNKERDVLVF